MDAVPASLINPLVQPGASRETTTDRNRLMNPVALRSDSASSLQAMKPFVSSQTASPRYIKQFQTLLEHQRQVFDEERALWRTERDDLLERIAQLEIALDKNQSVSGHPFLSPTTSSTFDQKVGSWSAVITNGSRHTSSSSTGEEVWMGSHPSMTATRTFSDSTIQSVQKQSEKLPSIVEDGKLSGTKKISFSNQDSIVEPPTTSPPLHRPSIGGSLLSRSLDGINFKSSGLPPAIVQQVMSSSPSVRSPDDPSDDVSPNASSSPPGSLRLPKDADPYTKDAGHTPIARLSSRLTALGGSGLSSGSMATPSAIEQERPPLAPLGSQLRVPSERLDSYFPTADRGPDPRSDNEPSQTNDEEGQDQDGDQTLSGPLALTNSTEDDGHFLSQLDSRLSAAAAEAQSLPSSTTLSPPSDTEIGNDGPIVPTNTHTTDLQLPTSDENKDIEKVEPEKDTPSTPPNQAGHSGGRPEEGDGCGKPFETPDSEPRLRIKRSMNFGSAFGEMGGGGGGVR